MKKREDYQQNVLYRLIKVLFVTSFLVVYGFLALIVTEDTTWKELNLDKTIITCNENWRNELEEDLIEFSAESLYFDLKDYHFENGSFKYKDYFQGALSEYDYDGNESNLLNIFDSCFLTEENISSFGKVLSLQRFYELKAEGYNHTSALEELEKEINGITSDDEFFNKLTFSGEVFSVKPNYKYFTFIWPLLIAFLGCIFAWEFVRRIFYYVVLGSMLFDDYTTIYRKLRTLSRKFLTPKS